MDYKDNGTLITLGLVGVVAAAGAFVKRGSGSMARATRVRGTGLSGDPRYARARLAIDVDPDLDREDREQLWDIVSTGSLPVLTTSESTDIDSNTWMVVARGTRSVQEEMDTLIGVVRRMPGVVAVRRI